MKTIKGDTEFSAWARQQQNKWRLNQNLPIGTYKQKQKDGSTKDVELGNYIEKKSALKNKSNFLTDNIRNVVETTLKNKEQGAKIEKSRLFTNLLSSQPLAFNLFAELSIDLDCATRFFSEQFDHRIHKVTKIIFEHSDGRGKCEYTCDHSAFDVFVEYETKNGKNGFIGIEVKYAESLNDKPAKYKERYQELSNQIKIFIPNSIETLKEKPLEQIWRDHLLAIAHLKHKNKKYDEGFFLYLFPEQNSECKNAVKRYIEQFLSFDIKSKKYNEKETGFYFRYMEKFVEDLKKQCNAQWVNEFSLRYFDK